MCQIFDEISRVKTWHLSYDEQLFAGVYFLIQCARWQRDTQRRSQRDTHLHRELTRGSPVYWTVVTLTKTLTFELVHWAWQDWGSCKPAPDGPNCWHLGISHIPAPQDIVLLVISLLWQSVQLFSTTVPEIAVLQETPAEVCDAWLGRS